MLARAATVPEGAVARLYLDGVDPEAYRLLDIEAVREAASAAMLFKLEPQFSGIVMNVELPDMDSMPARWERYVADQDLTGFDRDRIRDLGKEYLAAAVEVAD